MPTPLSSYASGTKREGIHSPLLLRLWDYKAGHPCPSPPPPPTRKVHREPPPLVSSASGEAWSPRPPSPPRHEGPLPQLSPVWPLRLARIRPAPAFLLR